MDDEGVAGVAWVLTEGEEADTDTVLGQQSSCAYILYLTPRIAFSFLRLLICSYACMHLYVFHPTMY